jgi:60 kDa SS-A/Ro ribonucleoprotein
MTIRYGSHVSQRETPQSEAMRGEAQVQNHAGGYVYAVDKWDRLARFLVLGADGGTYYVRERALTRENAQVVEACLAEDYLRTLNLIAEVSDTGRAPKNDPAILALAIAAAYPNPDVRGQALARLATVCRIPTHLFHFVAYVKGLRGFGPQLRRAIQDWYGRWTPEQLAFEVVKYQSRDGWSHRDVFRVAHPKLSAAAQPIARWAIGATLDARVVARKNQGRPKGSTEGVTYGAVGALPAILEAYEQAQVAERAELVALIRQHRLTREMVPSDALQSADVWEALLPNLGLTAVLRNLNKMTAVGLLAPLSAATSFVTTLLSDADALRKARVHPLAVLNALRVYGSGHGDKGALTWTPVAAVVDALDAAFYASFGHVTPTGKRLLLALDVSGSMSAHIAGTGLSCRDACAALALVTANVEKDYAIVGFTASSHFMGAAISPLAISPRQRLDDVVRYMEGLRFGSTDCALPMIYATKERMEVDAFCVYTDSETWAGSVHPKQALRAYREKLNRPTAAQVVVGMTATEFTIADPADPRTLDVVGFDLQTPEAIAAFVS